MRLDQALGLYVEQLRADGRSDATVKQAQRHVRLLAVWLGTDRHVEQVTHEDLARFLNSDAARMRPDGRPKRATSSNALRSSLRTFFGYAHAAGLTATNPARLIRRARCTPPAPRGLSRGEQERLLAVLDAAEGEEAERDRTLFRFMLSSGLRVGSTLALNVEDVALEKGEVYVRTAKNDAPFVTFVNESNVAMLRTYIDDRVSGPLFESRHRRRLSARQVQRRLWYWLELAGCPRASPHRLRHTLAARVYAATHDLLAVQAALNHRSLASSSIYVRIEDDRLRRVMEEASAEW